MTNFLTWIPELIHPILEEMDGEPSCSGHRRSVFERVIADVRMLTVYDEFLRRDRQTGEYFHRPIIRPDGQTDDIAQSNAIREVLLQTVIAAGDRLSVSKLEEIEASQQRWGDLATRNRELANDMELAAEHGALGLNDPVSKNLALGDLQALRRIANWLDHLKSAVRRPDDPLIVKRHRGDPIVRGVQIAVGRTIDEQFGERLDGTAATLTSVALGAETSPRASRSALADQKPRIKRSAP